ncbi:YcxB family protein [Enterovibrio sp. ZSDZ42]|uniref:YcxB family protein n=1 Tax=Enterovibrio gelatinilyticus TaxID=2899819 RepID=A0ABT5QZ60_9GAMM|nr:YcxB family protein [Enterovibrio sp. ZSDZ42]MDD1793269.1 YcxB family protein [Enterovibrio sp. ZSDZ42]
MEIRVNITKLDLFWMNSQAYISSPGARNIAIYAWLAMAGVFFYKGGFNASVDEILYRLTVFLGWAVLVYGFFYVLSTLAVLGSASKNYGQLGDHTYEVTDTGFIESTDVNETVTKWEGIYELVKTKRYLYIKTAPLLVYVIPLRSFSTETEFNEFYSKVKGGYDNASAQAH